MVEDVELEVDLRLFVTCRLCLDVQGHFQIDHNVQQQIKYCFDIDVEPFDGLPQLICKQCKNILREHYAIKKNFKDKQIELKSKLEEKNARKVAKSPPQEHESTSSVSNTKDNNLPSSGLDDEDSTVFKDDYDEKRTRKKKKVKKKRKFKRVLSSSSDGLSDDLSNDLPETQNACVTQKEDIQTSWDVNFNKYFVCRICSEGYQNKEDITQHLKKHRNIQIKYKNVFKMSCLVDMEKIIGDNKSNMCNSNKLVVYSPDYVIQNTHNPFYFTKYLPKTYSDITDTFKYVTKDVTSSASSDSADNEVIKRKRRRLLSRSSSETVVLNRNSEQEDASHMTKNKRNSPTVIDLIELVDSSDDASYTSYEQNSNSVPKGKLDSRPMQNIIKMVINKHNKRIESRDRNTKDKDYKGKEDFLQHKLLSIGRKIINNKGFNCTGLLRFLEYKDLCITWQETSALKANNDSKYVRIATYCRVTGNESSDTNNAEWDTYNLFNYQCESLNKSRLIIAKLKTFDNFKKNSEIPNSNENEEDSIQKLPCISAVFSQSDKEIFKVESDTMLKKLLNENPVSNPKQLPKKAHSNDVNVKQMKVYSAPNTVPIVSVTQNYENGEPESNNMPIVTSTVSLAHLFDKEGNNSGASTTTKELTTLNNQKSTYPRIKVKPVSELMPEKPTATINGTQNASQISTLIWPSQNMTFEKSPDSVQTVPAIMGNSQISFVWPSQNIHLNEQQNTVNHVSTPAKVADAVVIVKECMVLDTVEFPNTRTTSPFQYLRDLLLVHNIILLDANQQLPAGSATLIKMKLAYQQDKCEPISLCSSLFCHKNIFSIQLTDMKHSVVNINNLPANWQWQILQIYNDDVINKILQTASKISPETYKYTHELLTLLRSIKSNNNLT